MSDGKGRVVLQLGDPESLILDYKQIHNAFFFLGKVIIFTKCGCKQDNLLLLGEAISLSLKAVLLLKRLLVPVYKKFERALENCPLTPGELKDSQAAISALNALARQLWSSI